MIITAEQVNATRRGAATTWRVVQGYVQAYRSGSWRVVLRLRSSISLGGSMKHALLAALLVLVLLHPESLSVAAPTCCSASAFRENVVIGGESSMGPIAQTRTTTDCCTRCQSNPACDCCKCDVVCISTSFTHRLASQVFLLKLHD